MSPVNHRCLHKGRERERDKQTKRERERKTHREKERELVGALSPVNSRGLHQG